jgi:hypothetical protein
MKRNYILLLILASLILAGCESKEYREFEDTQIKIESAEVIFSATGGTGEVVVAEAGAFTATSNHEDWCFIAVHDHTITVTVTPNFTVSSRNARVTVKSGDKTKYISIIQTSVSFRLETADFNFPAKGDTVQVSYETEAPLKIEAAPWVKDSVDVADKRIILWAGLNPSLTSARSTTVTVLAQNQSPGDTTTLYKQSFVVAQSATSFTIQEQAVSIAGAAAEKFIPFKTDAWLAVDTPNDATSWLTASVENGEIVLQTTFNQSVDTERTTTLTLSLQDEENATFHTQGLPVTQSPAKFNLSPSAVSFSKEAGERQVSFDLEEGATLALDVPNDVTWLTAEVVGQEIVLQAEANMGISTKSATVTVSLQYEGYTFHTHDLLVSQQAFTFETGTYTTIPYAAGSTISIPFESDVTVTASPGSDWLTAAVVGQKIIVTATTPSPSALNTREGIVTVILKNSGGTTLQELPIPVVQDKNIQPSYADFLGTYTMRYSISYSSTATTRAIPVTLTEKVASQSYKLDGILPDNQDIGGELVVTYSEGNISITGQSLRTYPAGTNFTVGTAGNTPAGSVAAGDLFWLLPYSAGNAISRSTTYGVVSSDYDFSGEAFKFRMVDNGKWSTKTAGFALRIYHGDTPVSYIYGKQPSGSSAGYYYHYMVFEKQE